MQISIITTPFTVNLYGYAGVAANKNYGQTGFALMDRMWKEVRLYNLKHKGINHWVYYKGDEMFAGVELEEVPPAGSSLETRQVRLEKYAYYKHIGPYSLLHQAYTNMRSEIANMGLTAYSPGMEIYGHWDADESKLETEILMSVE